MISAAIRRSLGQKTLLAGGGLLIAAALQMAGAKWAVAGGLALFLAALPHGAFDGAGLGLMRNRQYVARYLGAGLLAALAFLWQPVAVLGTFLLLSAWHFASEPLGRSVLRRSACALIAVGGSALVRPAETHAIFAALCGTALPQPFMAALAVCGAAGCALAGAALLRQPRDPALWMVTASPVLFHPVLATGLVFWIGHAGPLTVKLARNRRWTMTGWLALVASGIAAAMLFTTVVPATPALLPIYGAAAIALVMPHLLPPHWLTPPGRAGAAAPQSSQAATSPAT